MYFKGSSNAQTDLLLTDQLMINISTGNLTIYSTTVFNLIVFVNNDFPTGIVHRSNRNLKQVDVHPLHHLAHVRHWYGLEAEH